MKGATIMDVDARIAELQAERDAAVLALAVPATILQRHIRRLDALFRSFPPGPPCPCKKCIALRLDLGAMNEALGALKAATTPPAEKPFAECTNPDCPVGCPDSHCIGGLDPDEIELLADPGATALAAEARGDVDSGLRELAKQFGGDYLYIGFGECVVIANGNGKPVGEGGTLLEAISAARAESEAAR